MSHIIYVVCDIHAKQSAAFAVLLAMHNIKNVEIIANIGDVYEKECNITITPKPLDFVIEALPRNLDVLPTIKQVEEYRGIIPNKYKLKHQKRY